MISPRHLYFALSTALEKFSSISAGSATKFLTKQLLDNFELEIHTLPEQQHIVDILGSLDDKVENNERIIIGLELLALKIYNFTFVVNDGISNWQHGKLSDLLCVRYGKDHKNLTEGNIPVYGSGGIMRFVNKALYNEESVLIPRKGTLSNIIYVNQPFWSVDTMFYTEMKMPNIAKYIYFFLKSQDLNSMNVGSAGFNFTCPICCK